MDCLEGLKKLDDESMDCIITDPPYAISQKGKKISRKGYHWGGKDIKLDFGEWDNFETEDEKMTKPISEFVNKIICGDCVKVMNTMPEKSVDLIFADPLYFFKHFFRWCFIIPIFNFDIFSFVCVL